jgi:U2 small nuclear ribonucleoprotein B''
LPTVKSRQGSPPNYKTDPPGSAFAKKYRYNPEYEALPPSNTIYVRNIASSVKCKRMKQLLNATFSSYGNILDVYVCKTKKIRGQAFVCFEQLSDAIRAKDELQGFEFLGRPLVLGWSKTKSHALMKKDGTYAAMMWKIREEWLKGQAVEDEGRAKELMERESEGKKKMLALVKESEMQALLKGGISGVSSRPTSHVLLTSSTRAISSQDIHDLVSQFDGFVSLSEVPSLPTAFVCEMTEPESAATVRTAMEDFIFPEHPKHPLKAEFVSLVETWGIAPKKGTTTSVQETHAPSPPPFPSQPALSPSSLFLRV